LCETVGTDLVSTFKGFKITKSSSNIEVELSSLKIHLSLSSLLVKLMLMLKLTSLSLVHVISALPAPVSVQAASTTPFPTNAFFDNPPFPYSDPDSISAIIDVESFPN
jgi:hypothetical protein